MVPLLLATLAFVPMLLEARRASRNERQLRAEGAVEPVEDVYPLMRVAYPACFLAIMGEAWLRGAQPDRTFAAGLAIFAAAKGLKYWAIVTLGPRWTFRVLVPPCSSVSTAGPYRFVRHPNYIGVLGELAGMALMSRALVMGIAALAGFGALIHARVGIEERALASTATTRAHAPTAE